MWDIGKCKISTNFKGKSVSEFYSVKIKACPLLVVLLQSTQDAVEYLWRILFIPYHKHFRVSHIGWLNMLASRHMISMGILLYRGVCCIQVFCELNPES